MQPAFARGFRFHAAGLARLFHVERQTV